MNVELAYVLFTVGAMAVFRFARPVVAVLVVFLGGWLLLPVGNFPPGSATALFPYWITGLAVPSNMLLTKAWVAPAAALLGVVLFDRAALLRLRPAWADLPMVLWCLWPLLQALGGMPARPEGWISSCYLAGCWGLPWILGRAYFATAEGQLLLLKALAVATVACLPLAVIEGIGGPVTYPWIYEAHPFAFDAGGRYVGFRPLGAFESGNQYGLWVSLGALAAVWLACAPFSLASRPALRRVVAVMAVLIALAAQSVGALLLLVAGLLLLASTRLLRPRLMLMPPIAACLVGCAVYLSGAVPIARIGTETAVGQKVVQLIRSTGRGSFTWRISQDQRQLASAVARPLTGTADWAWWRDGVRPWGLPLLIAGQFGLAGLALALATLLWPALVSVWRAPRGSPWAPESAPLVLAVIIGMSVLDAFLNSFIFFPALLIAGGLSTSMSVQSYARKQGGGLFPAVAISSNESRFENKRE